MALLNYLFYWFSFLASLCSVTPGALRPPPTASFVLPGHVGPLPSPLLFPLTFYAVSALLKQCYDCSKCEEGCVRAANTNNAATELIMNEH